MALKIFRLMILLLLAESAFAGVQMSLDGMISKSSLGLVKKNSTSGSVSLSVDLGSYVRLSYEHGQAQEYQEGYMDVSGPLSTTPDYRAYKSKVHQVSNGINLILILYGGDVIVPYIFGGLVHKQYTLESTLDGKLKEESGGGAVPAGGAALIIKASQKFSLKFTYKVSQSVYQSDPNDETKREGALDEEFKVGIQYTIKQ